MPLEVLREFARGQVERSSLRLAAEDACVGRSTLHKFITAGTKPHPRVRRLLGLWYLRGLEGVDELELIRPYRAALAVLLSDVPATAAEGVVSRILESIEQGFTDPDEALPRWLDVLRKRMHRWAGSAAGGRPVKIDHNIR